VSDIIAQSVLGETIAEYGRLAMEYATLAARNYALTQADIIPGSPPLAITPEQQEFYGRKQHALHVRLYESRKRLMQLTQTLAGTS